MITALKRAWFNADHTKLVGDDSKEKASLFAGVGQRIPEDKIVGLEVGEGLFDGLEEAVAKVAAKEAKKKAPKPSTAKDK